MLLENCLYCNGIYQISIANVLLCNKCAEGVFPVGYDDTRTPLHVRVRDAKKPKYELLKEGIRPDGKRVKILDFWTVNTLSIDKKKDVYEQEVTNEPNYH